MSAQDQPPPLPDPLPRGEWLYKVGELVFGPIEGAALVEKLQSGELPPTILVAREGRPFAPLQEVTVFVKVAAKADAKRRVDEELRLKERRRRRSRLRRIALVASAAIVGAGGAAFGVLQVVRAGVFESALEVLAGIEIEDAPPLVAARPHDPIEELEYLDDAPPKGQGRRGVGAAAVAPTATRPSAGFDRGAIEAVVERNRNSLHGCLREQVAREPGFRGEVPLTFSVGNDGRVNRLWLERRGYANSPLQRCMEAELAKWRFPGFEGERPSVSLSFRVGG